MIRVVVQGAAYLNERWFFFFSFTLADVFEDAESFRYITFPESNKTAWLAITTQRH